jgi:hypothetical protein
MSAASRRSAAAGLEQAGLGRRRRQRRRKLRLRHRIRRQRHGLAPCRRRARLAIDPLQEPRPDRRRWRWAVRWSSAKAPGTLHFVSREDGALLNRVTPDGSAITVTPVLAGNTVVVVTAKGGVFGYRPE